MQHCFHKKGSKEKQHINQGDWVEGLPGEKGELSTLSQKGKRGVGDRNQVQRLKNTRQPLGGRV